MTHYEVLRVSVDADAEAIRRAYYRIARRYHPDAGAGSSPRKFRQACEAYHVLRDPAQRRRYNRTLPPATSTPVLDAVCESFLTFLDLSFCVLLLPLSVLTRGGLRALRAIGS